MKTKNPFLAFSLVWSLALPGYHFQFPHDFFNHPDFQTEWWYYTGNLHTTQGRRFGFELTFFRQGLDPTRSPRNIWDVDDVWLAHFAVSDIEGKRFEYTERLNRSGAGVAGVDEATKRVWNGNWEVRWTPGGEELRALTDTFEISLLAKPEKPPVLHGDNGLSQKADGPGHASYYFSETRLKTGGTIRLGSQQFQVDGLSWMDHEFFTQQLGADLSGWDWFSLQLDDGSDVMLYRLRKKDGSAGSFSAGTYVDPAGRSRHLNAADFAIEPGKSWTSPTTHGRYPVAWKIRIYPENLDLQLTTRLEQQELAGSGKLAPSYWEGAIEVHGSRNSKPIAGVGYLEMTGYAGTLTYGM